MGTPSTPVMYAPQLFHGTSGEVTVPVSSTVRDSMRGRAPGGRTRLDTRLGRTSATYWSPATTLRPMAVPATELIRARSEWATRTSGAMSRLRKPASSMIAAKHIAPRMSHTVVSMLAMPPRENRSSIVALPLTETKPVASEA